MSKLKSILKWLLIAILVIILGLFITVKLMSESRPATNQTAQADALANEMLVALNKPAWDSLKFLKWEFRGGHKYLWDKKNNFAQVAWDMNKVLLNLDQVDGAAFKNGSQIDGEEASQMIQTAWSYWCNDSFWMFAPFKVFDPGTSRTIVESEGIKNLMVSYESGGVTPGDAYLWELDSKNIPTGYKMWTFIPIKGMPMSWENWKTLKGGAKVALSHKSKLLSLDMKDVQEGHSPSELGFKDDIFAMLK